MKENYLAENMLFDREDMTEGERQLFLNDFKRVCEEYFECDGRPDINITRTADGFSVCIIFSARRIKTFRRV